MVLFSLSVQLTLSKLSASTSWSRTVSQPTVRHTYSFDSLLFTILYIKNLKATFIGDKISQRPNLLKRTFPLHMTLNSDICCPVQRACSPSATEQAGKMLWKIVQFATRAVSYGGKSSLPSNVLHPSLRISIDSEDCLL